MELEPIEAKKAEDRRVKAGEEFGRGLPKKEEKVSQNFGTPIDTNEKGRTTDKVAKDVGFGSGRQYEKAKKVYEEAPEPIKKQWQEGKNKYVESNRYIWREKQ